MARTKQTTTTVADHIPKPPPPPPPPSGRTMTGVERRTLSRIAGGEQIAGDRCRATLTILELRGYIRCWPGEPPAVTEQGRLALAAQENPGG